MFVVMSERRLSIDVWSDVVCPWCYVGKRRLESALALFEHRDSVDVRWHSFELDPSAPLVHDNPGGQAERLARKYDTTVPAAQEMLDRMTRTAADDGIEMHFEKIRGGNTFDAHRLLHFAAQHGKQDVLKERLFRAIFTEGEPIAYRETLVKLAGEVGLDPDAVRTMLLGDAYADAVRADEKQAAALGIRGVPFFMLDGKYGLSGAQPADVLVAALERAWQAGQAGAAHVEADSRD
jgi:predicted DsbA family dithiol-disulfide isomerase